MIVYIFYYFILSSTLDLTHVRVNAIAFFILSLKLIYLRIQFLTQILNQSLTLRK